MGEQEAIKRQILSVDSVTQDVDGLKALIVSTHRTRCEKYWPTMKQSKHFGLFMFLYISTERRLLSVGNRHVSAIVDSCRSGPREVRGGYSAYCTHSTGKTSHSIISSPTRAPFNIPMLLTCISTTRALVNFPTLLSYISTPGPTSNSLSYHPYFPYMYLYSYR